MSNSRRMSVRALFLLCSVLPLLPSAAWADPASDAAQAAFDITEEHCAQIYAGKTADVADAYAAVAPVLKLVGEAYEKTQADYLLYWRAALYHCLGNIDNATKDYNAFIDTQGENALFGSLVRGAKQRLVRLGAKARVGEGPAATFLNAFDHLEIDFRYSGGAGFHVLACNDDPKASSADPQAGESPGVVNAACKGAGTKPLAPAALMPASLELAIFGWFSRAIGAGARARFDMATPSPELYDFDQDGIAYSSGSKVNTPAQARSTPGPSLVVSVGPGLRLRRPLGSFGRAIDLRIEPAFAIGFGQITPLAGSVKYFRDQGLLDAGTYGTMNLGGSLSVRLDGEIGDNVILSTGLYGTLFAPQGPAEDPSSRQIVAPSSVRIFDDNATRVEDNIDRVESVEVIPGILASGRIDAGFQAGLLIAAPSGNFAAGPLFDFGYHYSSIKFPDRWDGVWCYDQNDQVIGWDDCTHRTIDKIQDPNQRKVFSTERHDFYFRLGLQVRFGAGSS